MSVLLAALSVVQGERKILAGRLEPPCYVPKSYYPFRNCEVTMSAGECGKPYNAFLTEEECCQTVYGNQGCNAFKQGEVAKKSCWIPGSYHPLKACVPSSDAKACAVDWGNWNSWEECCQAGNAFVEGCTAPAPCYYATEYYPNTKCGWTADQGICSRGWGVYESEGECCAPGAEFQDGCT